MVELAKDRERSRKSYVDQVLSTYTSNTCFVGSETFPALNPSEKCTLDDLHGFEHLLDDYNMHMQDADGEDPSPSLLRQGLHGDDAFVEEVCEKLRPLYVY